MHYSLSYRMVTGRSTRRVGSAQMAVDAHRGLLLAGAGNIVMADEFGTAITLAGLVIAAEVEEALVRHMRPRASAK